MTERYLHYFSLPHFFVKCNSKYKFHRYNIMLFLENIIISVTSNGKLIKSDPPTCFFNLYLIFWYSFLRSIISSHFYGHTTKDIVITMNSIILLECFNLSSNSFVVFLCNLFISNNSVISHYITIFSGALFSVSTFISSCRIKDNPSLCPFQIEL